MSEEMSYIVTGGKDGVIKLRNRAKITQVSDIQGHASWNGGVSALCFSRVRSTLYTAGTDVTFLIWNIGNNPNPNQPIDPEDAFGADDQNIENQADDEVKHFKEILEEEFLQSMESQKAEFKSLIMKELDVIRGKLDQLLDMNDKAEDIEKLERDDFVIDLPRKNKITLSTFIFVCILQI